MSENNNRLSTGSSGSNDSTLSASAKRRIRDKEWKANDKANFDSIIQEHSSKVASTPSSFKDLRRNENVSQTKREKMDIRNQEQQVWRQNKSKQMTPQQKEAARAKNTETRRKNRAAMSPGRREVENSARRAKEQAKRDNAIVVSNPQPTAAVARARPPMEHVYDNNDDDDVSHNSGVSQLSTFSRNGSYGWYGFYGGPGQHGGPQPTAAGGRARAPMEQIHDNHDDVSHFSGGASQFSGPNSYGQGRYSQYGGYGPNDPGHAGGPGPYGRGPGLHGPGSGRYSPNDPGLYGPGPGGYVNVPSPFQCEINQLGDQAAFVSHRIDYKENKFQVESDADYNKLIQQAEIERKADEDRATQFDAFQQKQKDDFLAQQDKGREASKARLGNISNFLSAKGANNAQVTSGSINHDVATLGDIEAKKRKLEMKQAKVMDCPSGNLFGSRHSPQYDDSKQPARGYTPQFNSYREDHTDISIDIAPTGSPPRPPQPKSPPKQEVGPPASPPAQPKQEAVFETPSVGRRNRNRQQPKTASRSSRRLQGEDPLI